MTSIPLGPLMLASERLLAVVLMVAFLTIAGFIARHTSTRADTAAWRALLIGLVAARAGYVVQHFAVYRAEPWSILSVWQGGFLLWPGVLAALVTIGVMLRRTRAGLALGGTALVLAAAMSLAVPMLRPVPRPLPPGLVFASLEGEPVALDALRGKPVVINLWATWCGPCRREMPMLMDVARDAAVPVLLVNANEDRTRIRSYLSEQALPGDRVLIDTRQQMPSVLDLQALPTTLFIDGSGTIVSSHVGEISRAQLLAEIEALK